MKNHCWKKLLVLVLAIVALGLVVPTSAALAQVADIVAPPNVNADLLACTSSGTTTNQIYFCGHDCRGTCSGQNIANAAHRALVAGSRVNQPVTSFCPQNSVAIHGNCEFVPGPGCEHLYHSPTIFPINGRVVSTNAGSGWECKMQPGAGIPGCGGNNCGTTNRFEAKAHCVPVPQYCPKAKFFIRALPAAYNAPYHSCDPVKEYQIAQYCSGNCTAKHARVTLCANRALLGNTPAPVCRAIPALVSQPYGVCSPGESELVRFTTGTGDAAKDSKVTICCNSTRFPPVSRLNVISGLRSPITTGYPFAQWAPCTGQGEYQVGRYCSGGCRSNGDDAKITFCAIP